MVSRRKLLERIVQGLGATGAAFLVYPFIKAWLPGFEEDISLEVSLAGLEPGQTRWVDWLGRRVMIRRRSEPMLVAIESASLPLKDPSSEDSNQPEFASNVYRARIPEYFVAYTNCTHLGCEVETVESDGVGFTCPCHQSDFDFAGRVVAGAAATRNLEVPNYRFVSQNTLVLEPGD